MPFPGNLTLICYFYIIHYSLFISAEGGSERTRGTEISEAYGFHLQRQRDQCGERRRGLDPYRGVCLKVHNGKRWRCASAALAVGEVERQESAVMPIFVNG